MLDHWVGGRGGYLHGSLDSGQGVVEDAATLGPFVPAGDGRTGRVGERDRREPVPRGGNGAHDCQRRQKLTVDFEEETRVNKEMLERSTLGLLNRKAVTF